MLNSLLEIKKKVNAFNNQTVDLLKTIGSNVTDLINQVKNEPIDDCVNSNNEFECFRDINKNEFQFQQVLLCRMCNVSN